MTKTLQNQENLDVKQAMVEELIVEDNQIKELSPKTELNIL